MNEHGNKYGLTLTEYELMEYFWAIGEPKGFKEILFYFNTYKNKKWKKQTLSTFLKILQEKKLIIADTGKSKYSYSAISTKNEYIHKWTVNLCKDSYDNSISKFIAAFTGGQKISRETAEELRVYLNNLE